MVIVLVNYLFESSLCLILFAATYKLLISNLTHFTWTRFYILASLILSLVLPFIIIPIQWSTKIISTTPFTNSLLTHAKQTVTKVVETNTHQIQISSGISSLQIILYTVFAIYLIGIVFRTFLFAKNLTNIYGFIKKNSKIKENNYWLVNITNQVPAYSFFNYIFINNNYKNLSSEELNIIKNHETVHVKQYHTFDILFIELVGILLWFNPIVGYLKRNLQEIHEYIVDEIITRNNKNKKAYAELLLNLASESTGFSLAASFTGEYVKRRITMLVQPRSSYKQKYKFIILIPITVILLLSFSCIKNPNTNNKLEPEVKIDQKDWSNKSPFALQIDLKKYCGNYGPMVTDTFLRRMEILNLDNKLFRYIESESTETNRTIELKFISTNKFGYADFSGRTIEFILNSNNEVTGCILTRKDGTYKLFKENC
jgi:beta-lactamase regulating signal transducer with metallopeptidase domain